MSKIVMKSELARLLDLSRSTISSYLRRGMPEEADGRLDDGKCREWIRQNVRVQAGLRGHGGRIAAGASDAPNTGPSLLEAKRVRMTFDALLAEHRADRLAAGLVATEVAIKTVAAAQDAIRERFRSLPPWIAPHLVDATDAPVAASRLAK